jgi:SAM-dependent methyltransferase
MQPISPNRCPQAVWDTRYAQEDDTAFSWTEHKDSLSLDWITETVSHSARIADVGAGRSRLIDQLFARDYRQLTHVEWSAAASRDVQNRFGSQAVDVNWVIGDVCAWDPQYQVDLWHDRAVFHFQVDPSAKRRYLQTLHKIVAPGGYALIATFHVNGPEKCSGFSVARYDELSLMNVLEDMTEARWKLERANVLEHITPSGRIQPFQYVLARRMDPSMCS